MIPQRSATTEGNVAGASDNDLLEIILESWDRNNRILVNLLGALPPGGLEARAMPDSPSVGEMFAHIHYVRLVFLSEDAPQFPVEVPSQEWTSEKNADHMAEELDRSAKAVRDTLERLIRSGGEM